MKTSPMIDPNIKLNHPQNPSWKKDGQIRVDTKIFQ